VLSPSTQSKIALTMEPPMETESTWTGMALSKQSQRSRIESPGNDAYPALGTLARQSTPPPKASSASLSGPKGAPWTPVTPLSTTKLSMREIMDQTTEFGPSVLSIGLADNPSLQRKVAPVSPPISKLSQKERKKLQHQAALNVNPEAQQSSPSPSSPWKAVPKPKSKAMDAVSPITSAGPSTPHLTMRQTIAKPSTSKEKNSLAPTEPRRIPSLESSAQLPFQGSSASHTPSNTTNPGFASTPPLQPHSIRHTPLPARRSISAQHASMADIQSQQQVEKLIAAGAGEKRRLTDIQTEQQFQEWWEKESARVQSAREQSKDRMPSQAESSRGRGGRRRGRGGKSGSEKEK
jgi:hypothetical protein